MAATEETPGSPAKALLGRALSVDGAAVAITAIALCLRLIRRAPVWASSDAADLPALIDRLVCTSGGTLEDLKSLALYRLGGTYAVLIYLHMSVLSLLGLRATHTSWELMTLLVGTGTVYAGFRLARELAGPIAGLSAAALLAVCPLNIIQSRHTGAPWMYEEFCQFTLVYLLLRLPKAESRWTRGWFHVVLAVYFWTGNQMLGIGPVLGYGAVALTLEREPGEGVLPFLRRCFAGWSLLAPAMSLGLLLYATFVLRQGHLFHALYQKRHILGLYVEHWFGDMHSDIGPGATWFGLAAVLLATVSERRIFSTKRLSVVLFLCYAGPFWFLIPPGGTLTRGYITYGVGGLLVVLSMGVVLSGARKAAQIAVPACAVIMLAVSSGQAAYHLYSDKLLSAQGFQGSYMQNIGVKTAAYWIRRRPRTPGHVFSDASGGMGLEPQLMQMYFRRPYFSLSDAMPATRPYELFRSQEPQIDYLVVTPQNRRLVARYFGDFQEALRVTEAGRGELLLVYARRATVGKLATMDVTEGDRAFDASYSLLCGGG